VEVEFDDWWKITKEEVDTNPYASKELKAGF
jgi:hypothetical protein